MFFTKKMKLLFTGNKMESFIFVSVPIKGVFCTLNLYFNQKDNGLFQTWMLNFIQIAETPLLLVLRQKGMIPSCCPLKVVTFFGKDHVNWYSINEVMIGRSWKNQVWKTQNWCNQKDHGFFQNWLFNFFLSKLH